MITQNRDFRKKRQPVVGFRLPELSKIRLEFFLFFLLNLFRFYNPVYHYIHLFNFVAGQCLYIGYYLFPHLLGHFRYLYAVYYSKFYETPPRKPTLFKGGMKGGKALAWALSRP